MGIKAGLLGCKSCNYRLAFTLAEVLITLGIIGVVAAMTLPSIIQTNRNIEVESKLKKVYSVMNQAILMSEIDNGPKEYWPERCSGTDDCREYFNKYILKYLKSVSNVEFSGYGGYNIAIYFIDGSVLISKSGVDYFFYPNGKNFDKDSFTKYDENGKLLRDNIGTTFFAFGFYPSRKDLKFHYNKGFEPYKIGLKEFSKNSLLSSNYACTKENKSNAIYCTALIQLNDWKIPKDYPFRVK